VFIAKPQNGCKGDHIVLFQDIRNVPSYISKEMVVQRYIANPMLLNGFKFDLRVYVVVTGINEEEDGMHAFLADEGLARFCTQKYQIPNRENFKKEFMHLTNYSVNKVSKDYVE